MASTPRPRGSRPFRLAVQASLVALVTLVLLASAATVGPNLGGAARALLTLFTGSVTVARAGATAAGHTGDGLADGDRVATGADSKAAVVYPDGSVTRLDSDTAVEVHVAGAAGGASTELVQQSGLTWNSVKQLVGGSHFRVRGPNQAAVEVRGTEFGFYVEHDPAGNPVIWIDAWAGSVQVTGAAGPPVTAVTGQRVTVRQGAAPTPPVPIPDSDRQLGFTVFNQALDAATGTPFAVATGALGPGATANGSFTVRAGDLQVVLAWPGSSFRLTVRDPSGVVAAQATSAAPPLSLVVPRARAGVWTFTVDDIQSAPQEAWWVVAARPGKG